MAEFMERPRPLPADASIAQRLREIELALFGPEEPPEPKYIDVEYRVAGGELMAPASAFDRIAQLEAEVRRLRGGTE